MANANTLSIGEHLHDLMARLGIDQRALQSALDVDSRTFLRWLAGETHPQHRSRTQIVALEHLARRLEATFDDRDGVVEWLQAPSGYFGSLRPVDALSQGRIDAVNSALDALEAGVFV